MTFSQPLHFPTKGDTHNHHDEPNKEFGATLEQESQEGSQNVGQLFL